MKNFKKLFNVLTAVAVLSASFAGSLNAKAAYSDVVTTAYDYGYSKGMTTQSTIDAANPMTNSTRVLSAKALVQRAMNVKAKTLDTTKVCEYNDMAAYKGTDLADFAMKACQLGIMGVDADGNANASFSPNNSFTKAQAVIVYNRIINGNSAGSDWMAHKTQLAVITDTRDLTLVNVSKWELREIARKLDGSASVDCTSIENMLLCMPGADENCPAACKAGADTGEVVEVKAGSLNVALNSVNTLADNAEIPSTGTVRFVAVDFTASSSNDVSLKTVELKKLGLATVPTSFRVRFEKDGLRVSGKAAFTSEGTAVISFAPMFVVKKGTTENLDLYVELAGANINQNYQFASNSFNTTAETVNGSFTSPILRTAQYTVTPVEITAASNTSTTNKTDNGVEIGAFKVENKNADPEIKDVLFKSITLRQTGNGDISNLTDIVLERNGEVVSKTFSINSRDITFTVNNTIKDKTSATYYVKAVVNNVEMSGGDTYIFGLRNTTDLNVVESKTAFRSTVNGTPTLATYTIQGGELVFVRDANYPLSQTYSAGSEVVLMKGTVTSKSAMTLEDPTVILSNASNIYSGFSTIYLQIGSSTFSYSPVAGDTGAKFLGAATVDGVAAVKMYGTLRETAPAQTIKFEDLKLSSFRIAEYTSNGYSVDTAIGSIAGIAVESQIAVLNVTRTDGLGNTTLSQGSSEVTVYGLKLSSTQGNGVTVSRITLAATGNNGASGYSDNATLTLYVNGIAKGSKTLKSDNVVYFDFNQKITASTDMNVLVKATFSEAFSTGTINISLANSGLNAYDTLTSKSIENYAKPVGAVFTLNTAVGTLAESTNKPLTSLLLSPSTSAKIGAFKLSATNDGVRLYDVVVTGSNLNALSNFRLTTASGDLVAVATKTYSTGVEFLAINGAPVVAKDTSASYYVVADVNTNTTMTGINLTVATTGTTIKGSNGLTLAVKGTNVVSNSHATAENIVMFAKQTNTSKELGSSTLIFKASALGKNSVTISSLKGTISTAGFSGVKVQVYKNAVGASNLAFSGAYVNGVEQTLSMTDTGNATVDAGQDVLYVVVLDGAVGNGTNATQDWTVRVSDVIFNGFNAKDYNNLGAFPMTEVK